MPESLPAEPFTRIGVERARQDLLGRPGTVWFDIREDVEWQHGRIPGALHVSLSRLLAAPRQYLTADGVVFYCAQGIRSLVACEVAAAIGLVEVYNLEGGIQDWARRGFPVETPEPNPPGERDGASAVGRSGVP